MWCLVLLDNEADAKGTTVNMPLLIAKVDERLEY
jgi:hypothetical protein